MQKFVSLLFCASMIFGSGLASFLYAPAGFQGLIPSDLEELNHNFTEPQEKLLQDAILLLGEGQGDAVAYLKKRDPELAKIATSAFGNVEKKLEKMSNESIKFIAQVMDYLKISPGTRKPDKNGNPQVPKEVHEISVVSSWSQLDGKAKAEIRNAFPSMEKTLKSGAFKEHALNEMNRHGWVIN